MLRKRILLLLAGSFLMVSAAWADDLGYVDCASHPDDTKVFGKARQSQDVVGSVPCGERFTVLIYGFVFSRVETRDGKIGFIFSNLISVDHSGKTVLQPASERVAVPRSPSAAKSSASVATAQEVPAPSSPASATPSQPERVVAQSAPVPAAPAAVAAPPAAPSPAPTPNVAEITSTTAPASVAQPAKPEPATSQPAPAPSVPVAPAPAAPEPVAQPASTPSEPVAVSASPNPSAAPEPQPAPAEPVAPAVRDAGVRSSWEKPIPGARKTSLVELYGGYALSRFDDGGGAFSYLNGGIGAFAVNVKPWLQITGDSSYNFITSGSAKTVLYGNHFGPRVFLRKLSRWGATPFAEALVGGSRLDTTFSGTGGYKTSINCISYRAGGGVDIHPSRRFEIRLIDVDYYRTGFGTNIHQNNYWISTGIVIRLFGGSGRAD